MTTQQVHIARNGQVLAPMAADKIPDALEQGTLLPTDHYYDEATTSWIPVSQWKAPAPLESRRPERPPTEEEARALKSRRNRGKKSAAQKKEHFALGGWIACLFAVGAAAGMWAWAQSLNDERTILESQNITLKDTIKALQQENLALNEMTPAGRVRCIVTYDPAPEQVAILSGVTVGLYRRSDVERILQQTDLTTADFDETLTKVKASLPSPLSVTLSDSNGRVDMPIPQSGDYVLAASAANESSRKQLLWLAGFSASENPSNVLLLAEKDAISRSKPKFVIQDMRDLTTAAP